MKAEGSGKTLNLAPPAGRFDRYRMSPLALYVIVAVVGLWITLRLVANERQDQRGRIEHESRMRLHRELMNLRRNGLL